MPTIPSPITTSDTAARDIPLNDTTAFRVVSTLARLSAEHADLYNLLSATLHICYDQLPIAGGVVWLRAHEHDLLTPSVSRVPPACSSSAIAEDDPLLQLIQRQGHLCLPANRARPLMQLPDELHLLLVPIYSVDSLLGLLAFLGNHEHLSNMAELAVSSANVLSGALAGAWLRRQQAESEDVADTLFRFAGELREQPDLEMILRTLNDLALRVFNCDWSAVYGWQDGCFVPTQIMTRFGEQNIDDEPAFSPQSAPLLEILVSNPQVLSLSDLRNQPSVLPDYLERHGLRGLVLVPLQTVPHNPLGLLTLGYRLPLTTFSNRSAALAQGLARMVTIALDRTLTRLAQT
jgi:GAF domain-containing protein